MRSGYPDRENGLALHLRLVVSALETRFFFHKTNFVKELIPFIGGSIFYVPPPTGSRTVKVDPFPGSLWTLISPR